MVLEVNTYNLSSFGSPWLIPIIGGFASKRTGANFAQKTTCSLGTCEKSPSDETETLGLGDSPGYKGVLSPAKKKCAVLTFLLLFHAYNCEVLSHINLLCFP